MQDTTRTNATKCSISNACRALDQVEGKSGHVNLPHDQVPQICGVAGSLSSAAGESSEGKFGESTLNTTTNNGYSAVKLSIQHSRQDVLIR